MKQSTGLRGLVGARAQAAEQGQLYHWGLPVHEAAGRRDMWARPPTCCQVRVGWSPHSPVAQVVWESGAELSAPPSTEGGGRG